MRIVRALFVMLVLVLGAVTQSNAGLTNYWSGDGNASDTKGGADGAWVGVEDYANGKYGQAFSLNGSSYLYAANTTYAPNGTQNFTIDLWVNFNILNYAYDGSLPNVFIGQDAGGGSASKWVFYSSGDDLGFHINGSSYDFISKPFSFTTNEWYNIAVVRSGTTFSFYVNGNPIGDIISDIYIDIPNANLTIGQAEGLGYSNVMLDEIRIYDSALTQNEIYALVNPVPIPSGVWLFGSGLVGLIGLKKRRLG